MTSGSMNNSPDELLTIADAAAKLGIVERRLRRLLQRPEYTTRTLTQTRQTSSGIRTSTALPSDLIADIRAHLDGEQGQKNVDSDKVDTDAAQRGHTRQTTRTAGGNMALSEKNVLLVEQLQRQQEEIAFLRSEVERRNQAESELRRLMLSDRQELAELKQRLAITAKAEATDATQDAPTAKGGKEPGEAEKDAGNGGQRPRRWWQIWKG